MKLLSVYTVLKLTVISIAKLPLSNIVTILTPVAMPERASSPATFANPGHYL